MGERQRPGQKQNTEPQIIGIRADANEKAASGHIMRCITIAKQLIALGGTAVFFTADECADELLDKAGMRHVCLHTDWTRMETETETLVRELRRAGCTKLLVDSYQVTENYFRALADPCRLIYMDDCLEGIYPVDMIVNYNPYHTRFPYEKAYGNGTRLLLGPAYAPLREEFTGACEKGAGETAGAGCGAVPADRESGSLQTGRRILISVGGGDICGALPGILEAVMEDDALCRQTYEVVVGRYHQDPEKLERLAMTHDNIRLHCRVEHMADLMSGCAAAVSAAGTTLLELCAMQVPTVFLAVADNQRYDSEYFAKEGRMLFAGDIRENRKQCLQNICGGLRKILEDRALREEMGRKLGEITDGGGARRIAEEILRL